MKTINTYIISASFLFATLTIISCENLLDVDVPANQIDNQAVYEDSQTANSALSALYANLWQDSPIAGAKSGSIFSSYTDELDSYAAGSNSGVFEIATNQQTDSNLTILLYWSKAYQNIYYANAIIEGIENSSSLSIKERNKIKAEALLIRCVLNFYLTQIFGDIPYITSTNYQVNQSLPKTEAAEVLEKIQNDLNESIELLPDTYRNNERIFPNKKVAQLMLAKIYMLQSKWIDSENILKDIIQSPLYSFQNDITKVFNKSGSHILWQLKPQNAGNPTQEATFYYFQGSAPYNYALSQDLINAFAENDLRKQNWIAYVTVNQNKWYRPNKYKNLVDNATEYSIVFRLEETYLLLAESLAQQGKIEEALPYVNATRVRAALESLTMPISKNTLLDEILIEDRKEFFTEMGHRFLNLKRHDKLSKLVIVKPNWKEFHKAWPIPQSELLSNPNLNPQNTGY